MVKKISIITITYNCINSIEKTIKSVLNQNYENLEYVIIDGDSNDGTTDIIRSYLPKLQSKGIEVKYISEKDQGISDAFNKGVLYATGDIVGIINSDDALLEDTLKLIATEFNEDIDVLYGNCIWEDYKNDIRYIRKSSSDLSDLNIKLKILHPTAFIKLSAYKKYGLYSIDYKYCMDKELFVRMQKLGARFRYIDKVLVSVSAGGVSDQYTLDVFNEGKKIAINSGVPLIKVKWIFKKNYLIFKWKKNLKKIYITNFALQFIRGWK